MRRSLTWKLIAAFLGVSLLGVGLVAVFGGLAATMEFNRFVGQEAQSTFVVFVSDYYASNGNLNGIDDALRTRLKSQVSRPPDTPRLIPFGLADASGVVVLGGDGYDQGEKAPDDKLAAGTRIIVNGETVGTVLPFNRPPPRNLLQDQFLQRTGTTLLEAAIGGALVAI